jgi:hypothetical protein
MARLVAAFDVTQPMLASRVDWQAALARDKARQFVDFDGNACDFDTLLARAGGCAGADRARDLTRRHGEAMAAVLWLRDDGGGTAG